MPGWRLSRGELTVPGRCWPHSGPSGALPGLSPSSLGALLLSFALTVCGSSSALADGSPSVRLEGANIPRAKALALDAALLKGWQLAESGRAYAIFETPLDTPASPGPADARASETTLLRIRADFIEADGAVIATLRAEEVWRPFTPRAWTTDITDSYRGNLDRALASLHRQWDAFIRSRGRSVSPTPPSGSSSTRAGTAGTRAPSTAPAAPSSAIRPLDPDRLRPMPAPSAPTNTPRPIPEQPQTAYPSTDQPVGIWAFDAERLARRRGCDLDDRGAVLVSDKAGVELHRIGCLDRPVMLVRCNRERCWAAR